MHRDSQIVHAEAHLLRVPLETPWGDGIQKFSALELPVVLLRDAQGRSGVGFGYTTGAGGSAIRELLADELLGWLVGQDARRGAYLIEYLRRSIHSLTPGCIASTALAAIDCALWDLAGHRLNTPLHLLLGGAREQVPLCNTDVGWLNRPLEEILQLSERAVMRDGFRALKLDVGKPDPEEDCERVARVRETVGPAVQLMINANQSWTFDQAVRRLKKLEQYRLFWIEDPLPAEDISGYARLGNAISIPRAGGARISSPAFFLECIRAGALDVLQPDIACVGGISAAMAVCHLARAANLPVAFRMSPELSIAVAAAVPHSIFVEFIPQMAPVLNTPLKIKEGYGYPFNTPGHGIKFEESAMRQWGYGAREEI